MAAPVIRSGVALLGLGSGTDAAMRSGVAYGQDSADAPTGYTLTADAGTFALTGQDVALKRGLKLPLTQASFALTGQDVAFAVTRRLVASPGAFVLTAFDVALKRALRLSMQQASFALTGSALDVVRGGSIVLDPATFTLAGQAVGLTAAHRVTLAAGLYSLTGVNAALRYSQGFELALEAGVFTLNGGPSTATQGPPSSEGMLRALYRWGQSLGDARKRWT